MNTSQYWFSTASGADLGDEIAQSLRFDSNGYLYRNQISPNLSGNRTFTFSTWFKHGDMNETQIFGIHPTSGNDNWLLGYTTSNQGFAGRDGSQGYVNYNTVRKYRDPNAWYHLFLTCSSGVLTLYVNGEQGNQTMTQNHSMDRGFYIGSEGGGGTAMDGYLAETYFIQGTVLHPVNDGFIRLNENGVYVPDTPTISSYGTNGFYLKYDPNGVAGGTGDGAGVGADHSGNGNHFTTPGVAAADKDIQDTPTQNWATMQPLYSAAGPTYSGAWQNGNLSHGGATSAWASAGSTIFLPPTGKYYAEIKPINTSSYENWYAGIFSYDSDYGNNNNGYQFSISHDGTVNEDGTNKQTGVATFQDNDIIGVAVDMDTRAIEFFKNGSSVWSGTASATFDTYKNADAASSGGGLCIQPRSYYYSNQRLAINYGQQGFAHTPPTGYKALQTNNLPEPSIKQGSEHFQVVVGEGNNPTSLGSNQIAANSYTNPCGSNASYNIAQAFDGSTATYFFTPYNINGATDLSLVFDTPMTGTTFRIHASVNQGSFYINGTQKSGNHNGWTDISTEANGSLKSLGFSGSSGATDGFSALEIDGDIVVDLAIKEKAQAVFSSDGLFWIKNRVTSSEHQVVDSVRGLSNVLQSPTNGTHTTYSVLDGASVAWCWKGGGTAVSNTDGTITSSVSANTDAGFSIVTHTGNGSNPATVGHGLSKKPEFIITKRYNAADYWSYWHKGLGLDQGYGYLNFALAQQSSAVLFIGISNSLITFNDNASVNGSGGTYVSYVWHGVEGFSKFGSFEGTGTADGAYVYLGFKPKLIMLKNADTTNQWSWFDSARDPYNTNDQHSLSPLVASAESGNYAIDFLSNGFKCRDSSGDINNNTMTFCAWGEYPFGGENVPPAPAY